MAVAEAQAQALFKVGEAANTDDGQKAVQLELAAKAIQAKEKIAKDSTIVLLPDGASEAGAIVAQATSIIDKLTRQKPEKLSKPENISEEPAKGPWDNNVKP